MSLPICKAIQAKGFTRAMVIGENARVIGF